MNDLASAGCLWIAIASYDPRFSRICQNYIGSLDHNAFRCDLYQSGEELLAALQNGLPYRAVLMDNAMSDMDASEFCSRLRQMEPRFRPWLLLVPTCSVDELNSIIRSQDPACPQGPGIRRIQMAGLNSLLFDLDSMLRAQSPEGCAAAGRRAAQCDGSGGGQRHPAPTRQSGLPEPACLAGLQVPASSQKRASHHRQIHLCSQGRAAPAGTGSGPAAPIRRRAAGR